MKHVFQINLNSAENCDERLAFTNIIISKVLSKSPLISGEIP